MSWDAALRSSFAAPSYASIQLQDSLRRGGSFESKIFSDDFFEAMQHSPAVKDALSLGGNKGIEALLGYLNPLLEDLAERVTREAAAAAATAVASSGGGDCMDGIEKAVKSRVKDDDESENVDSEHDYDDAADDDELAEMDEDDMDNFDDDDDNHDGVVQRRENEDDGETFDDDEPSSMKSQGQLPEAYVEMSDHMESGDNGAAAVENGIMGGP
jgi:hypothetical protein